MFYSLHHQCLPMNPPESPQLLPMRPPPTPKNDTALTEKTSPITPLSPVFRCDQCNKSYNNQIEYRWHMNWHRWIYPYVCKQCNAGYSQASDLAEHVREKHSSGKDANRNMCDTCGIRFLDKHSLLHHVWKQHGPQAYLSLLVLCAKREFK